MMSTPLDDVANALREAEDGRQHELPWLVIALKSLLGGGSRETSTSLERTALQPERQPPLILHRQSLGQLVEFVDAVLPVSKMKKPGPPRRAGTAESTLSAPRRQRPTQV